MKNPGCCAIAARRSAGREEGSRKRTQSCGAFYRITIGPSRGDCYRCGGWEETAGVIGFNFMRTYTRNFPVTRSDTRSYFMAHRESSLPIQDDRGFVRSGTDETNIEKCSV